MPLLEINQNHHICASIRLDETTAAQARRRRERVISHFSAGECTERGRPVKALRFAPTAMRRKELGLD